MKLSLKYFLILFGSILSLSLLLIWKLLPQQGGSMQEQLPYPTVKIITETGIKELTVEIANSPRERRIGLSERNSLDENHGMLFLFSDEQSRTFWMKDTFIPLDIIFLASDRKIVHIAKYTTPAQIAEVYPSQKPAQYVLEVNAGWADKNNVQLEDVVELN